MDKVKEFFNKVWEVIKKTPGWVLFAVLLLLATVWFLIDRQRILKRRLLVQKEITKIETDHAAATAAADATNEAEEAAANEKFEETMEELKAKEKELKEASQQGPVAVANAWKDFLTNRSN